MGSSDTADRPLLTFYGDDFTGSTDAMEALAKAGLRTALFIRPPKPEDLTGRFAGLHAVGVAGIARSLPTERMADELTPVFECFKKLGAPFSHYKTCSTFDSSPVIGSIGRAAEIGQGILNSPWVPVIIGAPILKRYLLFGNLFATVGDETFRIDRHPTMSRHPVTPMDEADMRLHLAKQTDMKTGLCDVRHLAGTDAEVAQYVDSLRADGMQIILFDTLDETQLEKTATLLWNSVQQNGEPLYLVGSSGVEYALAAHWQRTGTVPAPVPFASAGPVDPLLVVSGSASPVTAAQIEWAGDNNFTLVRLNAEKMVDADHEAEECARAVTVARELLEDGQSVLLYTACGPDDPALDVTRSRCAELGIPGEVAGHRLGACQGRILNELITACGLKRVCVAGGDTSGHTVRQLGITALEVIIPTAPGGPLCRAAAPGTAHDGLEIALKGGQVGTEDYFGVIRQGTA